MLDQLAVAYAPALALLTEEPDLTPSELARRTGKVPNNISRDLNRLAADGYLTIDGASRVVTDKGRRAALAVQVADGDVAVSPDLQMLRADELHPHPLNPRKTFEPDALDELRSDIIQSKQIISSLLVRPVDPMIVQEGSARFWIVAGERRWRAVCEAIREGDLPLDFPIPCRVNATMTDREHLRLAIAENLQRADLNHVEQGEAFKAMIAAGATPDEIGDQLSKSAEYVRQHVRILKLPAVTLDLLRLGAITFHKALEMERELRLPEKAPAENETRNYGGFNYDKHSERMASLRQDHPAVDPGVPPKKVESNPEQPDLLPPSEAEVATRVAARAAEKERQIDDAAVDAFAIEMKEKLASARAKGRAGWHDHKACTPYSLADGLLTHVAKGDPIDIANFAMFVRVRSGAVMAPDIISKAAFNRGLFLSPSPQGALDEDWRELILAAGEAQLKLTGSPVRTRLLAAIGRVTSGRGIGGTPVTTLNSKEATATEATDDPQV